MRGFAELTGVGTVLDLLENRLKPLPCEAVGLHCASGRVLAKEIIADLAIPPFDRAAMDGYALRTDESPGASLNNPLEFDVIGAAFPGKPYRGAVNRGQAIRIMTGAPLPAGADTVLKAEEAHETGGRLRIITGVVSPGRHVGRRGEDIEAGTLLFKAGRILRPQDVGVLASIGASPVSVVLQPRVEVIVTGDELLPCGSRPEGFQIVDSNSVMLEALIRRDGGVAQTCPIVPDTREAVKDAILASSADLIFVSGGSSVGQEDHAPSIVAEIGELSVRGIAVRPAAPTGVGFLQDRAIFLLPGNPVSCLCAYDLFAGRAVRRLGGRPMELPFRTRTLPLARKLASAMGRMDYVRVLINDNRVEPLATSGASILSSTTRADGFVLIPGHSDCHPAGEMVTVHLYE